MPDGGPRLDPDDEKLVVLARAARARIGAPEGAAVRDRDGRSYAAATVDLPSLKLSALQLAVANAVAAGAGTVAAAAVVSEEPTVDSIGYAALRDLSADAPVHAVTPDGRVVATLAGTE